jgi:hypothetical protein
MLFKIIELLIAAYVLIGQNAFRNGRFLKRSDASMTSLPPL